MRPLVSVIVPVYNVEEYLVRCLDSLCQQSLFEIEILLVDDASQDRCGKICDEYVKKDSRFRVFHNKTNQGLSFARNVGIDNATGIYLMFVDSDDWVHNDFCKCSYECAIDHQADLVMFGYQRVIDTVNFNKTGSINSINVIEPSGYKTKIEAIDLLHKGVKEYAWNKLYKKELFDGISYPSGFFYEDVGTTYRLVWKANCIYYMNKILYYYRYNKRGITALNTEKSLDDWFEMHMQQYQDLVTWNFPSDKLEEFIKKVSIYYCIKKKADTTDKNYLFCNNILTSSKTIPPYFTWKGKVLFILFKYYNPLFEFVCTLFRTRAKG